MKTRKLELKKCIELAKKGNQKSFSYLLNTFWNDVYGFQLKRTQSENDAEDITIQAFAKAFEKIKRYDNSYSFKTWLITISKNLHIDLVRKRDRDMQEKASLDIVYNSLLIADDSLSAEDKLIIEQNTDQLLKDIKKLKPHYQEVINLRYFQEFSYKEIAEHIGEPLNNVKVKLLRAKRLLFEIITDQT